MSRRSRRQTRTRLTTGLSPWTHNDLVAAQRRMRRVRGAVTIATQHLRRMQLAFAAFAAPMGKAVAAQIEREQRWQRRDRITDCITCMVADSMTPMHDPSPSCQSGSRPHCTCDTCY